MSSEDFEYQLLAEKGFVGAPASQEQSANTFVDPSDGTVYEWDEQKRGWFPKVLLFYQMHTTTKDML